MLSSTSNENLDNHLEEKLFLKPSANQLINQKQLTVTEQKPEEIFFLPGNRSTGDILNAIRYEAKLSLSQNKPTNIDNKLSESKLSLRKVIGNYIYSSQSKRPVGESKLAKQDLYFEFKNIILFANSALHSIFGMKEGAAQTSIKRLDNLLVKDRISEKRLIMLVSTIRNECARKFKKSSSLFKADRLATLLRFITLVNSIKVSELNREKLTKFTSQLKKLKDGKLVNTFESSPQTRITPG